MSFKSKLEIEFLPPFFDSRKAPKITLCRQKIVLKRLTFDFYIWYFPFTNIYRAFLFRLHKQPWRIFCKIGEFVRTKIARTTKNLIRILWKALMKEFVCNKVLRFQVSVLLKMKFFQKYFSKILSSVYQNLF